MNVELLKEQIVKELSSGESNQILLPSNSLFASSSFRIDKRRSVLLLKNVFNRNDVGQLLSEIDKIYRENRWQSYIVFGETNDVFDVEELTFFDNVSTLVRLYLINTDTEQQYYDKSWTFLDCSISKFIKKIRDIANG